MCIFKGLALVLVLASSLYLCIELPIQLCAIVLLVAHKMKEGGLAGEITPITLNLWLGDRPTCKVSGHGFSIRSLFRSL